jgi:thiol-disulfide isomerase/thioredoxin
MKLVVISAIWCPACLIMGKRVKEMLLKFPNWSFEKLDLDMDEDEALKWNPGKTLPVFIVLDENGNEIRRVIGELSKDRLEKDVFHG